MIQIVSEIKIFKLFCFMILARWRCEMVQIWNGILRLR